MAKNLIHNLEEYEDCESYEKFTHRKTSKKKKNKEKEEEK